MSVEWVLRTAQDAIKRCQREPTNSIMRNNLDLENYTHLGSIKYIALHYKAATAEHRVGENLINHEQLWSHHSLQLVILYRFRLGHNSRINSMD